MGETYRIVEASGAAQVAACRDLFVEYQRELGVSLCFQGFDRELAALPGDYAPPRGRLLLALNESEPVGCVALRALPDGAGELKRLYVRAPHRGSGLGRRLALRAIAEARALGYPTLRLDTLPSMRAAQRLYGELGFRDAQRYNANPVGEVRFMALDLAAAPLAPPTS